MFHSWRSWGVPSKEPNASLMCRHKPIVQRESDKFIEDRVAVTQCLLLTIFQCLECDEQGHDAERSGAGILQDFGGDPTIIRYSFLIVADWLPAAVTQSRDEKGARERSILSGSKETPFALQRHFVLRKALSLTPMSLTTSIMLSSSFLGSRHSALVLCPLLDRRPVRQFSSRRGARSALREHPKWSTLPGGCLPSLGRGRELQPSLQVTRRAREVRAQVGGALLPPALALGAFAFLMAKLLQGKPLEIIGGSSLNAKLLPKLTELEKPYKPYPLLSNRHVETIFASYVRSLPKLTYRRECLTMADGGSVALDWPQPEIQDPKAVLILLPGLTGGSDDSYVQHFAQRARSKGWAAVVFNSRGCAEAPVTTAQIQSALFTEDLRRVVKHTASLFPSLRIYATGWSVGANILVRYLGQEGERCPLAGAVSLCNVFDLEISSIDFHKGFNKVYNFALAKALLEMYTKNAHLFKNAGKDYNFPLVEKATTIREFDDGLTRVTFGYKSVDEYYYDASSCRSIKDVRVPLLCVQALTDPIAPERAIPRADAEANPNCLLVVTPYGGHLGWVAGPEAPFGCPWTDPLVMQYLEVLEEAAADQPGLRKA